MSPCKVVNRSIVEALAGLLLLSDVTYARAQELGTAQEAKAMLDRAIAALESNEATALSEFNDPNNKEFHDRDLYVFCFRMSDGKITAYSSPGLLGIDIRTLSPQGRPDWTKSLRWSSEFAARKPCYN
jgi:hypothetical protein